MILLLPWIPILGALLIMLTPESSRLRIKSVLIVSSGICFAIVLTLLTRFNPQGSVQFIYSFPWIPSLGIQYKVGLDGINMTLCLLHALVSFAGAFVTCSVKDRFKEYSIFYLILTGAIYGVFTALDIFVLYLFYEMTLTPLYPMIIIWGSKNKEYGAMKLTLFITAGAVLSLFGIFMLYQQTGAKSFDWLAIQEALKTAPLDLKSQNVLAALFLIGFGVIASLWPLHSWSPIGYAAAPTSVSMLHAGVLKKMGPYLMLRLAFALAPEGVRTWAEPLAILAGIGILYAGYAAMKQTDLKFIIGFSSVSHMGYVLLGFAGMNLTSVSGAVLLMFSHGVMAAATFACIGFLYEQTHARSVRDYGGLGKKLPFIAFIFTALSFASLGLPGFSNFVSELLVFIGTWKTFPVIVGLAIFGVLITAIYLLRMVQQVVYGTPATDWTNLKDASNFMERFPLILLLGALILFGFWPQGLLRLIEPAVGGLLP